MPLGLVCTVFVAAVTPDHAGTPVLVPELSSRVLQHSTTAFSADDFFHSEERHPAHHLRHQVRAQQSSLDCNRPLTPEQSKVWDRALELDIDEYPGLSSLRSLPNFADALAARGLEVSGDSHMQAQRLRHAAQVCLSKTQPDRHRALLWMEGAGHGAPYLPIMHTLASGLRAVSNLSSWTISTAYIRDDTIAEHELELSLLKQGDLFVFIGWMGAPAGTKQEGRFWTKLGEQGVHRVYYQTEPMVLDVTTKAGVAAADAGFKGDAYPFLPHDVVSYRNEGHGDHPNASRWGQPPCFYTSMSVDEIWDYSHQNIERCASHASNEAPPMLRFVPAGVQPTITVDDCKSASCERLTARAVFVGSHSARYSDPHRIDMIDQLSGDQHTNLVIIDNAFSPKEQADVFCKNALFVNLHRMSESAFSDCSERRGDDSFLAPFESVRAATHLSYGVSLLSERSHPRDEREFAGLVEFVNGSAAMIEAFQRKSSEILAMGVERYTAELRSNYTQRFSPEVIFSKAGINNLLRKLEDLDAEVGSGYMGPQEMDGWFGSAARWMERL